MQNKLSEILKLAADLTTQELMRLNQAIVPLIKAKQDIDFKKAAITYAKGDIVLFQDSSGASVQGVITKKNPKTLQVTTPDNYYVNIPATYISSVENPSKELLDFRKSIMPTYEEMLEVLECEMDKFTFN